MASSSSAWLCISYLIWFYQLRLKINVSDLFLSLPYFEINLAKWSLTPAAVPFDILIRKLQYGSPALFYLHVSFLIRNLWSQWTLPVSFENFKKCYITILIAFSCDAKCFAIVTLIFSSSPFPSPHFCWKDCQKIVYQLLMIRYPGSVSKIGSIWLN